MQNKEKFYKKVSEEYENFKKNTLNNEKIYIFDNAFEIVIKDYIYQYLMENENFTEEEYEKMNGIENLIDYIFDYFLENGEYLDFDELCEEGIEEVLIDLGVKEEILD